ncbi:hypothetical protein [Agaribacterium haliotis]|uniref:hypothetical protein n=1 Tax=Agaribacterium haliotis TaxID=2013869 RepID=UPI000BB58395|nr:hypothetical protein [Agaribacterium haliotis]
MKMSIYIKAFLPLLVLVVASTLSINSAVAEPYLAQRYGQKCMACHTNMTGGGKRNAVGVGYAMALTDSPLQTTFSPALTDKISAGANLRVDYTYTDFSDPKSNAEGITGDEIEDTSSFDINTGNLYLEFALSDEIIFYLDQEVAPEGGQTREAIAIKKGVLGDHDYIKAGRFFLPFGLRLQDDSAFIREVSGFNFDNSDNGVEYGYDRNKLSFRFSVSNGTQGSGENNKDKQVSSLLEWVDARYRVGVSASVNNGPEQSSRKAYAIYGGLTLGKWVFLAELDKIDDEDKTTEQSNLVAFLEANYLLTTSTNVKLSYDYHDPNDDIDENQRIRYSLLGETFLDQFSQLRYGLRWADGIPQNTLQNQTQLFTEYHVFF